MGTSLSRACIVKVKIPTRVSLEFSDINGNSKYKSYLTL